MKSRRSPIEWGVSSLTLGPAASHPPILSPSSTAGRGGAVLDRFFRIGGDDTAVTPTEAHLAWDMRALYVLFRCTEPNSRYRPPYRGPYHGQDYLPLNVPADMVVLHLRPSWADDTPFFMVTVHSSGDASALRFAAHPYESQPPEALAGCETSFLREDGAWLVRMAVPWSVVGQPVAPFGLNLFRFRGQSSEILSPVALDSRSYPAPDLFMEVTLGGEPGAHVLAGALVTLPSGARRWQRAGRLAPLERDELEAIWKLQQSLAQATVPETLAERLHVVQRWLDLMVLEGFNFRPNSGGGWVPRRGEHLPHEARSKINRALRSGDVPAACTVLDALLAQLNRVSRRWFADGSPGNLRTEEWTALDAVEDISVGEREVRLYARAGERRVVLNLSCPVGGGLRVHADQRGFFNPESSDALCVDRTPDGWQLSSPGLSVTIQRDPLLIVVRDASGRERLRLPRGGLALRFASDGSVLAFDMHLPLTPDEAVYGFGERFDTLDQRGRVVTLWDLAANEGTMFGPRNQSYKPIPLLHSTRGYTMFLNTSYRVRADVGHDSPERLRLSAHGPVLDLYLWVVPPLHALEAYTTLTGKPILPPRWAFEPWIGGQHRRWQFFDPAGRDAVEQMLEVAEHYAELDVPHTVFYTEGGACEDPRLHTVLAAKGLRLLAWRNSAIPLSEQRDLLPDVTDQDLPALRRGDGTVFTSANGGAYVDFRHPGAVELLRAFWAQRLDLGVAGSMVDFGDEVPEDATFYDGRGGDEMHNAYARDYHHTFHTIFSERRGNDHILFARGAAAGSQRWLCQFAGDHPASLAGLSSSLRGGLTLCASGFSTWGSDAAGHAGWPDLETYVRWLQFACFSPLMRYHGNAPLEPWYHGEEAIRLYKRYVWLRHNLMDYLYSASVTAHRSGWPMMRALPLAFPDEAHLSTCDDAYLLGSDLLVAPVHRAGEERMVPFPAGRWTHLWNGRVTAGPTVQEVAGPLEEIPVYLRAGAMLPVHLNSALRWGESMSCDRVAALVVTPPAEAAVAQCWDTATRCTTFTSTPTPAGFSLQLVGRPDTRYLLIYGAFVTSISIGGTELPYLRGADIVAQPPGWFEEDCRVIVRLPHGLRQTVEIGLSQTTLGSL